MSGVLVTGFEPYGNTPTNPAQLVATELDGAEVAGAAVTGRVVPNAWFTSIDVVMAAVRECAPDVLVMLGETRAGRWSRSSGSPRT